MGPRPNMDSSRSSRRRAPGGAWCGSTGGPPIPRPNRRYELRVSVYDAGGKQLSETVSGAADVRTLFDFHGGNCGRRDRGVPKTQSHGSAGHLRDALATANGARPSTFMPTAEPPMMPDQRPIDRRERARRGRGLVHGQERPGLRLPRVFARWREPVWRSGSRRRHQLAGPARRPIAGRWIGRCHVDRKD